MVDFYVAEKKQPTCQFVGFYNATRHCLNLPLFFLLRLEKKNDIKNKSSYNNFRRNEHRNAALFSKEAESLFFVINLPGAPFSKRCVARSFYLKC